MMLMMGQRAERLREERRREEESARMRKELRHLARDRRRKALQAKLDLQRQDDTADHLLQQCHDKELEIAVSTCGRYKTEDRRALDDLMHWLSTSDACEEEFITIRREMADLKKAIKETDCQMEAVRKEAAARKLAAKNLSVFSVEKVLKRQDQAVAEFGRQLEENRKLVEQVHHLKLERARVAQIHDELNTELTKINQALNENVDVARNTYDQVDSSKRRMASVALLFDGKKATYQLDMKNLNFKIGVLKRTERFMVGKNKQRKDDFSEQRLALRLRPSPLKCDNDNYRKVMQDIEKAFENGNIDTVVNAFLELVAENFMLFRNVSERRERTQELLRELAEVKHQTAQRGAQMGLEARETTAREKELWEKKSFCESLACRQEQQLEMCDVVIRTYIDSLLQILRHLGYSEDEILRLAGVYGSVEERNAPVFFAEVEQYVNKLFEVQNFVEFLTFQEKRRQTVLGSGGVRERPPRLHLVSTVTVLPPAHADEPSDALLRTTSADTLCWPHERKRVERHVTEELEARAACQEADVMPCPVMSDVTQDMIEDCRQVAPRTADTTDVDVF